MISEKNLISMVCAPAGLFPEETFFDETKDPDYLEKMTNSQRLPRQQPDTNALPAIRIRYDLELIKTPEGELVWVE